jgi:hypothetical protein
MQGIQLDLQAIDGQIIELKIIKFLPADCSVYCGRRVVVRAGYLVALNVWLDPCCRLRRRRCIRRLPPGARFTNC